MSLNSRVTYYYDDDIGNYTYGEGHPMKPYRIRLAHELISSYQLLDKLNSYQPKRLDKEDLIKFHCDDFIDFLREVTPDQQKLVNHFKMTGGLPPQNNNSESDEEDVMNGSNGLVTEAKLAELKALKQRFDLYSVDNDCPIFDGLYEYCRLYSGGSVGGALRLNRGVADIAINWAGGLHHAKKAEVSGFCYTNDIVLAIIELLRYHQRVLYIDIDVHHGDGVEEAFYTTDRVMTVSFHHHGNNFFPATGALTDVGEGQGKNYALNFPLDEGIDDNTYQHLFKSIIGSVMTSYKPGAIVLQCGADSLTGDKLGPFNLTLRGHGSCVQYCKSLGVPLLLLGGGGYTVKNVSRCWAYETAIALGVSESLNNELPFNNYIKYWGPDYKLHLDPMADRPNKNAPSELQQIEATLLQQLKELGGPPSVQYSTQTGHDSALHGWREERDAELKESEAMDLSADGAVQGRQHAAEFYANNLDQDAINGMGIGRPKPPMSINSAHTPIIRNDRTTTTATASTTSPMEQ